MATSAIPFGENRGQSDARVAFQARTLAGPLFVIRQGELVWSPSGRKRESQHETIRRMLERLENLVS